MEVDVIVDTRVRHRQHADTVRSRRSRRARTVPSSRIAAIGRPVVATALGLAPDRRARRGFEIARLEAGRGRFRHQRSLPVGDPRRRELFVVARRNRRQISGSSVCTAVLVELDAQVRGVGREEPPVGSPSRVGFHHTGSVVAHAARRSGFLSILSVPVTGQRVNDAHECRAPTSFRGHAARRGTPRRQRGRTPRPGAARARPSPDHR